MATPTTPVPFEVWTDDRGEEGFLHGTKADLKPGDLIEPGRSSNYGRRDNAAFVYLTATLDAATWQRGASKPSTSSRHSSSRIHRPELVGVAARRGRFAAAARSIAVADRALVVARPRGVGVVAHVVVVVGRDALVDAGDALVE